MAAGMLMFDTVELIGRINIIINTADIAIKGMLSNFLYLTLQIISKEITTLIINAMYGLNNPLR